MAAAKAEQLEDDHQPRDVARQRVAEARAVRQDEVALQLGEAVVGDAGVGEEAETGVHAVDRLAPGDDPLDRGGGGWRCAAWNSGRDARQRRSRVPQRREVDCGGIELEHPPSLAAFAVRLQFAARRAETRPFRTNPSPANKMRRGTVSHGHSRATPDFRLHLSRAGAQPVQHADAEHDHGRAVHRHRIALHKTHAGFADLCPCRTRLRDGDRSCGRHRRPPRARGKTRPRHAACANHRVDFRDCLPVLCRHRRLIRCRLRERMPDRGPDGDFRAGGRLCRRCRGARLAAPVDRGSGGPGFRPRRRSWCRSAPAIRPISSSRSC